MFSCILFIRTYSLKWKETHCIDWTCASTHSITVKLARFCFITNWQRNEKKCMEPRKSIRMNKNEFVFIQERSATRVCIEQTQMLRIYSHDSGENEKTTACKCSRSTHLSSNGGCRKHRCEGICCLLSRMTFDRAIDLDVWVEQIGDLWVVHSECIGRNVLFFIVEILCIFVIERIVLDVVMDQSNSKFYHTVLLLTGQG